MFGQHMREPEDEMNQELKFKFNIGTEELREIVQLLNKKPFEQNFTLVSFDELGPQDSLELVNTIFAKLDKKHDVKLKDEGPEKTLDRFIEFLRVLSYPGKFDDEVVKRFMEGDKKVLHPIIYYCLVNFESLIKRAYLGKFLVPIIVPDEYMADEEMKNSYADYQNLIEEFKQNHKVYAEKTKAANPATLKKEISQLEHDKDLLNTKIKEFREKFEGKEEFHAILREITLMRKEQEEEQLLGEKLRQQKRLLDKCDEDLLMIRQKHFDAKKAVGDDATPDEMLFALRQEVARVKNKISEISFELKEKRKKMIENEQKLYEPIPPQDQIEGMKNKVSMLRNHVADLARRVEQSKNPEKEDKLFIQRQQETMVKAKKEKVEEDMKRLEQQKTDLEDRIREKAKDLEKLKGPGYAKKSDLSKYNDKYNEKKARQMKMEQELSELKAENNTLKDTLSILHQEKIDVDKRVMRYEKHYGVEGLRNTILGINTIIEDHQQIDAWKGKSVMELTTLAKQLATKLEELRPQIEPQVLEHKRLKNEIMAMEPSYKEEKAKFDGVTADAKSGLDDALERYNKEKVDVYSMDSKIDILDYQIKVVHIMKDLLDKEIDYQDNKKTLNSTHKSYKHWMQSELTKSEATKGELKQKREFWKKNYEQGKSQIEYLKHMEYLLQEKLRFKKEGRGETQLRGTEKRVDGMNVLTMNE